MRPRRLTLQQRLHWWPEDWPEWAEPLIEPWDKLACLLTRHMPIPDQCNIPAHDYCGWCGKSMPGQGERP